MDDLRTPSSEATPGPRGLVARVVGVLTSPRATYAEVAARPRWLGVLCVVLFLVVAPTAAFFSTEVGRQALLDQQIRTMESFGRTVSDAQYQRLEEMLPYAAYFSTATQLVLLPFAALVIAGIALVVFNVLLGGDASFTQVFSVVVHAGVLTALHRLFVLPLDYVRESLSSPSNLTVFLPFLDENTFPARLLGAIDLFLIWWVVSLAIGLGVLYRKPTTPIALSLLGVYVAIAIVMAAVKSVLSGA